jgi:hypothetical protein
VDTKAKVPNMQAEFDTKVSVPVQSIDFHRHSILHLHCFHHSYYYYYY